jgi:DTW domain-containing protein YfiP
VTAPAVVVEPRAKRESCARCERPLVVCVCSHVTILPTRTRVLLLQHPRERRVGIGTVRLAHVALPSSTLRVGLDFARDPVVTQILADAVDAPAYVLFPGPAAVDIAGLPRDRALTLVVLDGTWWQARKLLRLNPALAALPRVAFTPRTPSDYRIRRQPAEYCVSTIEALAEALTALEPPPEAGSFDRLLDPFRAMVARQEWFAAEVRSQRHRYPVRRHRRVTRRTKLAARLAAAWPRVVCLQGEANAWPTRAPGRPDPEIVHWVAHRPATGQTYEAVIAPRQRLAPSTPAHLELSAQRLLAGGGVDEWQRSWRAFSEPGDLLVTWGHFYDQLAVTGGLALGEESIDLRPEVSQILRQRFGAVEECLPGLEVGATPLGLPGRAGRRLAALVAAVTALRVPPAPTVEGPPPPPPDATVQSSD